MDMQSQIIQNINRIAEIFIHGAEVHQDIGRDFGEQAALASLWQHQMKGRLGKRTPFGLLAILGILALVVWPVASQAKPELPAIYTVLQSALDDPAGTLLRHEPFKLPRFYRAKAWRIIYVTRDFRNRPIASSGIVVLSDYAQVDRRQRNIVAWAHPTTGVARRCAPSLRSGATGIVLGLPELVARGYVVVASDYPGLGTAGPIGYHVSRGQAFATLDSVRAARQIPEVGASNRFALWGYSQVDTPLSRRRTGQHVTRRNCRSSARRRSHHPPT